ncbi:MAG: ABC transporter ATP-binding protein [Proteobacteria bacterium]|nr:ABC transporter ATP-binding protein [Pseudomonadota bacterium]MCP4915579.1 ABC transporter ATP-binding protein [Pseudomonadota bacterium]
MSVLSVQGLQTYFDTDDGVVKAVNGVSFDVNAGEILGLVGESGSGKSVTNLSILRLVPTPPGRYAGGRVLFKGEDVLKMPESELRGLRGKRIAMIFQDPMTSLNPYLRVSRQIGEVLELHEGMSSSQALKRSTELLEMVGIPDPAARVHQYPHEFSGGMRQRVMIAMALACKPELLLADEPTTALDVTIQAQILELIRGLCRELGTAVILVTHDLGVVAGVADRVAVMYAGRIVEQADVVPLFRDPQHPYTRGLLASVPRLDTRGELQPIEGLPPNVADLPPGCAFAPRCANKVARCAEVPPWFGTEARGAACWELAPKSEEPA